MGGLYPIPPEINEIERVGSAQGPYGPIAHVPGRCRKDGDSACIYSIRW